MLFLASIDHHRIGLDAAVGTDDNRAVALALRGIDTFGDIHLHGTFPRQSSYHFSYHPSHTRSKVLMGKELDGRGGGIRTPDPLLPKQMRYQAALRPDVSLFDCIANRIRLEPEATVRFEEYFPQG